MIWPGEGARFKTLPDNNEFLKYDTEGGYPSSDPCVLGLVSFSMILKSEGMLSMAGTTKVQSEQENLRTDR